MLDLVERPTRQRGRTKAEDRIDARLPAEAKQLIEYAASLSGVSITNFVVSHAYEAAQNVVREHDRWELNRSQSRAFVESILNPPAPNEALRRAAERYKAR